MEINQLVCFCRVGPYILNEGGMLKTGWAPGKQQPVRFTYLEGNQTSECFWEMEEKPECDTGASLQGGAGQDDEVMDRLWRLFFFFIMSSVEGFVLWEHTLWCCLQERPPFGLQVDELDQLLVRTVGTLTLDWQSFIPGRIHRASHKKIKHDALLLDIYWCPVGLRQMTISIINESISWVYEMLKKGGNSLSQLPRSEGVILKLPFLSRIPKLFIWLQMTEKINRLTNILKIQLLQLLYS